MYFSYLWLNLGMVMSFGLSLPNVCCSCDSVDNGYSYMDIYYFSVVSLNEEMQHVYFIWFGFKMWTTNRAMIWLWLELGYGFDLASCDFDPYVKA